MRKIVPVLGMGAAAALLAGCASTSPSSPAAAGAGTSVTSVTSTAEQSTAAPLPSSSSSSDVPTPTPTPTTPSTARKTSATKPSTKPSSTPRRSTTSGAPKPTVTPSTTPTSHPTTPGAAPTSFGYPPYADTDAQIGAAKAAAKADGREVLLDFGASWCGNCVAMDDAFHTSDVQAVLASSYHLVQIDADTNMGAISPYDDMKGFGLPVLIVLSPSGSVRVDTSRSGNPSFDLSGFLAFLKKWAL